MTMAAPPQAQLEPEESFKCWHPGPPSDGLLHVALIRKCSRQTSALERLALDARFTYKVGSSNIGRRAKHLRNLVPERENGKKNANLSNASTTTIVSPDTRRLLRNWGFDLTAVKIEMASPFTTQQPPSHLPASLSPATYHSSFERLFLQRLQAVDDLLRALDRARSWSSEQLFQLCSEVSGCPADIVETLRSLFGENLSADFIVDSQHAIGSSLSRMGRAEHTWNDMLHDSVVAAANGVLALLGMVDIDIQEGALEPSAPVDLSDRMAADALVRGVQLYESGSTLSFFDCGSSSLPTGLPQDSLKAFKYCNPDWILISNSDEGITIHGVVEHKLKANCAFLVEFCTPRVSPLTSISTNQAPKESTQTQPAESSRPSKRARLHRNAAPVNLRDRSLTPENNHQQRKILDKPTRGPAFGYIDKSQSQKVALQVSSQLCFHNVRNGLLWSDYGRALLPIQLAPESDLASLASSNNRHFALLCSRVVRSDTPPPVEDSTTLRHDQTDAPPMLDFTNVPNVIMGLVKWAIFAQVDQRERGRLIPAGYPTPLSAAETDTMSEEESSEEGSGSNHPGVGGDGPDLLDREVGGSGSGKGGPGHSEKDSSTDENLDASGSHSYKRQTGSIPASSLWSCDNVTTNESDSSLSSDEAGTYSPPRSSARGPGSGSDDILPATHPGSGKTRRTIQLLPFASGRFADVFRGTIQRPGLPEERCVFKFNCPPGWRLSVPGESSDKDEDEEGGALGRFNRELEVLRALENLQGTIVPRFLGTSMLPSKCPDYPRSLVLEDVGKRIDDDAWPANMSNEQKRNLVVAAYSRLHEAGWVHGDVAPRNILVSHSSEQDAAEPAVRVCLVDFARATPLDQFTLSLEECDLKEVLDDLFNDERDD